MQHSSTGITLRCQTAVTECGYRAILVLILLTQLLLQLTGAAGSDSASAAVGRACRDGDCRPGRVCGPAGSGCACGPPGLCSGRSSPVCGSDGRLYPSHCELHRRACWSRRRVRPARAAAAASCDASVVPRIPVTSSPRDNCLTAEKAGEALLKHQCVLADCDSSVTRFPRASQAMLDRLFAFVDSNGDRLASRTELVSALSRAGARATACDFLPDDGDNFNDGEAMSGVGNRRLAAVLGIRLEHSVNASSAVAGYSEGDSETEVASNVDSDCLIRCPLATVGRAERIEWRRHGLKLPVGAAAAAQHVQVGETLALKAVTVSDAGIYQCCSSLWTRVCVTFALSVIDQPRIRVHPPMQVRRVGEPAALYCRVKVGSRVAQLRWLFNSRPLGESPELALRLGAATDDGSSLRIPHLDKRHTGMFTCSVANSAGRAESAGFVYVRDPTETDYSSYPLSAEAPVAAVAAVFHSGGYAIMDVSDCAVKLPVSAGLCKAELPLSECAWGPLAAAGRLLYAAQPRQRRLLALRPPSEPGWFSPEPVPLPGCRPQALSYRRQADTLWIACDDGHVLRVARASSASGAGHRPVAWPDSGDRGGRVLRLPDSRSNLLVRAAPSEADNRDGRGVVVVVAVSVPDVGDGGGVERVRVKVSDQIDRADLIVQGGTLLLHASRNSSLVPLVAMDLVTGSRIPYFSRFFPSAPTGRLVLSDLGDRVLHLAGDTMYLYRVLPSGQLAITMHDTLDTELLDARFQTAPDGSVRLLATTGRQDGALLEIVLEEGTSKLLFDPRLGGKPRLSAPDFGHLAIAHSADSAVFINASGPAVAACHQSLFVGLQAVHWLGD